MRKPKSKSRETVPNGEELSAVLVEKELLKPSEFTLTVFVGGITISVVAKA